MYGCSHGAVVRSVKSSLHENVALKLQKATRSVSNLQNSK